VSFHYYQPRVPLRGQVQKEASMYGIGNSEARPRKKLAGGDHRSDGGRAVNAPRADWPKTLRGEAAEIYLRREHDLKPHGFGIAARVLDFPGGMPGDIGLFLVLG
jgi:hypothetical protein